MTVSEKISKQRAQDKVEFLRDTVLCAGITSSMLYVISHTHMVSYADLKKRWCDLANNLTDEECRAMWEAGNEAKLPERLRDEELENCFFTDRLVSNAIDTARKKCSSAATGGLLSLLSSLAGKGGDDDQ